MIGVFKIPRLEKQMRFDMAKRNSGKFGPLVVGMAFGAGWTPCIGPILAGILTIAASSSSVVTGAGGCFDVAGVCLDKTGVRIIQSGDGLA